MPTNKRDVKSANKLAKSADYGDFKLLAAIGAWLGWQVLPVVVLVASLAAAGWIAMLWGEPLARIHAM